jgi:glycosyltransferase involved in cell wall biosynthesis
MRPKLLFLCQTLPFPPDGGAHIRSYHLFRLLSEVFDVTGLFFFRRATRPTPESVSESVAGLEQLGTAEAFPILQEGSRARLLWDHARSVAQRRAYTVFAYDSSAFRDRLRELLASETFDLVHMDSLDLAAYVPDLGSVPIVCGHHNVESALLARRAEAERSWARQRYMGLQATLTAGEEARWCPGFAGNITCSKVDSGVLRGIAPGSRVTEIPNGVDVDFFCPMPMGTDGIVFVGGHSWFPNRDGMEWFANEVLPDIRARRPDVHVTWVGRVPSDVEKRFSREFGIRATGYVDDVRPYLAGASCVVVPIRVGGGTRLKILDAWAMGRPMVSTSVGCEGLEAVDGGNMLIRDSAAGFAEAVEELLADPNQRQALGSAGRRTAEDHYAWGVIGTRLTELYRDLGS